MNSMGRFLRDDTGAVTMEFTVLMPFFIFLMVLFADAATIYLTYTEMYNASRELSRRMSTGELQDEEQVEAYAASKLFLGRRSYVVDANFSDNKSVVIAVRLYDAAIFGYFFRPILGKTLLASATAIEEPQIE